MGTTAHDESYLSRYRTNIVSKLETIDLFLKTKTPPYKKAEVRAILGMTKDELDKILNENNIKSVFFRRNNEKRLRRALPCI